MLFSNFFNLNPNNGLDFFDINIFQDTKRFVDPYSISQTNTVCGVKSQAHLNTFMNQLLKEIKVNNRAQAELLCSNFNEPNGTRFGYSKIKQDGHGAGSELSMLFLDQLYGIKDLINLGHLKNLEETLIVCEGIGRDTISDITINIIKHALIEFTQEQCHKHGIPIKQTATALSYFCIKTGDWATQKVKLPHIIDNKGNEKHIILIPKHFLPNLPTYDYGYFYNNVAQNYFKKDALQNNSTCVSLNARGERRVLTRDLKIHKDYSAIKLNLRKLILNSPETLNQYRVSIAPRIFKNRFS